MAGEGGLPVLEQPSPIAIYPEGQVLVRATLGPGEAPGCAGCSRGPQLLSASEDGNVHAIIASLPLSEAFVTSRSASGYAQLRIPFRDDPEHAISADGRLLAHAVSFVDDDSAGTYRVTLLGIDAHVDLAGATRAAGTRLGVDTIFDRVYSYEPRPVTSAMMDSSLAETRDRNPPPAIAALLRETRSRAPSMMGAFSFIDVGDDTTVWIRVRTPVPNQRRWLVLDRHGDPVDAICFPPHLSPLAVGYREMWVQESDEFGVPSFIRYRIER
jgi:hypothetical protein